ncbi:transcriptional regulator [Lacinutrix neustonica]|uniref:Transcriptional regulator n=1 Tax=Lacinutrix neustonica TaxID=2980107 RepID=A0A9E8MYB4_9FLAO|nr:transcriptional regulator [Lacinutrix neustonica]
MVSIITGDIINSRDSEPKEWLPVLKKEFNKYGGEPKSWEIFRGDSFQLEVNKTKGLRAALLIKAAIKQNSDIDVRMAIGIGTKSHNADKITEANGTAFINSGHCFEHLKRNTLAVETGHDAIDYPLNIMIDLAALTTDNWTPTAAETLKAALEHPNYNQKELAKLLEKTQSNISAGLKRYGYDEIIKLLNYYEQQTQTL